MAMHFRQAIVTKWLPSTNTKPSRIKATCDAGTLTMSYDHGLDICENHARVAMALVRKLGWTIDKGRYPLFWHAGSPGRNSSSYVFVGGGDSVSYKFAEDQNK